MKVYFENIQGFYGKHSFELIDGLNTIHSEKNGTGKTTFFECVTLLSEPTMTLTKRKLMFMINKDCDNGVFYIDYKDIIYGFRVDRKGITFFRQFSGEDVETSFSPFTEASRHIGVLIIDGKAINIFNRFSNIFSSSKHSDNFNIINTILENSTLNEIIERTSDELKNITEGLKRSSDEVNIRLEISQSLPYIEEEFKIASFINDYICTDTHDILATVMDYTESIIIESYSFRLETLNYLLKVKDLINQISIVNKKIEINYLQSFNLIENVSKVIPVNINIDTELVDSLQEVKVNLSKIKLLSFTLGNPIILDKLLNLTNYILNTKEVYTEIRHIELNNKLNIILSKFSECKPVVNKDLNIKVLQKLGNLIYLIHGFNIVEKELSVSYLDILKRLQNLIWVNYSSTRDIIHNSTRIEEINNILSKHNNYYCEKINKGVIINGDNCYRPK